MDPCSKYPLLKCKPGALGRTPAAASLAYFSRVQCTSFARPSVRLILKYATVRILIFCQVMYYIFDINNHPLRCLLYTLLRVFTIHDQCFMYLNHAILRYYLPLVLSVRTMCVALVKRVLRLTLKALCAVYAVLSHSTKTTFLLGA